MSVGISKEAEKEQKLVHQESHVEGNKEQQSSQGNTKLMMETDTDESIDPETYDVNALENPNPILSPL